MIHDGISFLFFLEKKGLLIPIFGYEMHPTGSLSRGQRNTRLFFDVYANE